MTSQLSSKIIRMVSVLMLIGAGLMLFLPACPEFERWVSSTSSDNHVEQSTLDSARWIFRMLGSIVLALSLVLLATSRPLSRLLLLLQDQFREFRNDFHRFVNEAFFSRPLAEKLALGFILAGGFILRAFYIDQPMRSDESYSFVQYINQGPLTILSVYTAPNNHVFSNLLCWMGTAVLGVQHWVIRLPSFISGVLLLPLIYALAFKLNKTSALWATALVSVSIELISYSVVARGYALISMLFIVLLLLALYLLKRQNLFTVLFFSVLSMFGFWTVPTMLFPFGIVLLFLCLTAVERGLKKINWDLIKRVFQIGLLTSVLTLMLYIPILGVYGADAILKNRYVTPLSFDILALRVGEFFQDAMLQWGEEWGWVGRIALLLLALWVLVTPRKERTLRTIWLSALVVFVTLTLVQRRVSPLRGWLFFVPIYSLTCAIGLRAVLGLLLPKRIASSPIIPVGITVILSTLILSSGIISKRIVPCGLDSAEKILLALKPDLGPDDVLVAHTPSHNSLEFYFLKHGVAWTHLFTSVEQVTEESLKRVQNLYIVVNKPFMSLEEQVDSCAIPRTQACEKIMEFEEAEVWKYISPTYTD